MSKKRGMRHAKKQPGFWGAVWGNRSTGARIAIAVAAGLLALILLISVAVHAVTGAPIWVWIKTAFFISDNYNQNGDFGQQTPGDLSVPTDIDFPEGITNVALFGIDSRSNNMKGLSDSIMVISVDANNNTIKLISILRDSLVKVEGHGYQKINAAYNLGGPTLAVKTLNQTFDLNIVDYATVDFVGMSQIIEAVGGIDTVMTKAEVENANAQVWEMHLSRGTPLDLIQGSGQLHLNGIQAVAYSRVRYVDVHKDIAGGEWGWGDYGRTLRQRYVMNQMFQKALTLELAEYPEFIEKLLPFVESSLTYGEIYDLAMILLKDGIHMEQARIPTDKAVIDSGLEVKGLGQCVYYDLDYAAELVHGYLFKNVTFEEYMELNGIRRNKWLPESWIVKRDTDSDSTDGTSDTTDSGNVTDTDGWENSTGKGTGGKGTGGSGTGGGNDTTDIPDTVDSGSGSDTTDKVTDTGSVPDSGTTTDSSSDKTDSTSDKTESTTDSASEKPSNTTSDKE